MRSLTKKMTLSAGLLVGLLALASAGTMALFTDRDTIVANAFDTGTIALTLGTTSALVSYADMVPGDQVSNTLLVTNSGNAPLRYSLTSVATNTDVKALKDQLVLEIRASDVTSPLLPCDDFDGAVLYSGDLDAAAGVIFGAVAVGQDSGDRALAASGFENLCFRVVLPLATGNAYQDAATTATFTFDAEQTENN